MRVKQWVCLALVAGLAATMATGCRRPGKRGAGSGLGPGDMITDTGLPGEIGLPGREGMLGAPLGEQFANVLFDFDSARVNDSEIGKVEAVAQFMKANGRVTVVLEGHCDERGSNEYNMALGERRALAVRAVLMNMGVDAGRIQTKSFGEERPKDPGHNEEAWRVNRRVEFVLMGE